MNNTQQLYIPSKIKVGFQNRQGTYTGKLAYVVFFDKEGKLRKETSWEQWRDKKIDAQEFENVPTEGFVLNKGVGGQRESYGWNARNEYIRVYDPRDFEFEISLPNLLFILRECNCNRGKGLEGKFVYSWDRDRLVLLPVSSPDYQQSANFTELQGKCVGAKDLVPGLAYITKKQEVLTYLGRLDYFFGIERNTANKDLKGVSKKYVFWDGKRFICRNDVKNIAAAQTETPDPNFAEIMEKYIRSAHGSAPKRLFLRDIKRNPKPPKGYYGREDWSYETPEVPGLFICGYSEICGKWEGTRAGQVRSVSEASRYMLVDNVVVRVSLKSSYSYNSWYREKEQRYEDFLKKKVGDKFEAASTLRFQRTTPTDQALWVEFESGAQHPIYLHTSEFTED